jgi:hypothetical protein
MKMPTMTIRNVEPDIYTFYREQAARHGRSMEEEVRRLLEENRIRHIVTGGNVLRGIHNRAAEIGGADDFVETLESLPRAPMPKPMSFDT